MKYFIALALLLVQVSGIAQRGIGKDNVKISGKIVEDRSDNPIEFASILLIDKDSGKTLDGITTSPSGDFEILTQATNFFIEVRFMGFTSKRFDENYEGKKSIDLGLIKLEEDSKMLKNVVVEGERSQTEFKLDRRVFNVGSDLSTTGASALEVLDNVPSVEVSIDGEISLRGSSGVNILINGKPSVLAKEGGTVLGTLTADMIEKIEVITSPSAKYEAEGTTGIINIVLKKEDRKGVNGSVSLNTGVPDNHSVGFSLNRRSEKLNLFSQIGVGRRLMPYDIETINKDIESGKVIENVGERNKYETFYNLILGADYNINPHNVITLSGSFAFEQEDEYADLNYRALSSTGALEDEWLRDEDTEATNPKYQYELHYKKTFEGDEDRSLLFSAIGDFFGKDQSSVFKERNELTQRSIRDFMDAQYIFSVDYTHPFTEKVKVELGSQYKIGNVLSDFELSDYNDGEWIINENATNVFDYMQKVFGVYSSASYEGDKFGLKMGVRMENTALDTELKNTNEVNNQNFTDFFPSVHASYKFNDNLSMQAGYSSRITRPSLWDLNPFVNIRDVYNVSMGNPNLTPEYTDSYEFTTIYKHNDFSFSLGVYHRFTTDVIEDILTYQDGISISKPENVGDNSAVGAEFNMDYTPFKWLVFIGGFNYNYFKRTGTWEEMNFNFESDQWRARLKTKLKLPKDFDVELTGMYRSDVQTVQSTRASFMTADMGVRKKILKGKAVLNLSVRDIFASRVYESESSTDAFYLYEMRQRGRSVIFGVSFGFGKGEAMEYSSGHKFH
ncbi:outer membrane beta-barrel family protein [Aureibacter tunicatorum]|uniref:Outer membrane receptor protein involved in Fe transport n=1 Tax=Aureibacter tunicatorum TaxID=866807 RepID=A0AAE3XPI7_9BACT|nr:outer membrane beta-barrel family protein [Aureibacter tunicatorum]MDR6240767.1 outer membrane receptor protein involved in Fe transport [Aureibacter tunicatorum]BDD06900.1 TonB-dependent receptor [Aureibacter tunicatorum]